MTIELTLLTSVSHRGREITAPRIRGLLALLAGELRSGRAAGRLVEGLWPEERPENPTKALQILVSRARRHLGAEVIESTPTGYRLTLREDQVDTGALLLHAAESAVKARAGDHAGALAEAEEGLALWDGAGTDEDAGPGDPLAALRAERAATHQALVRHRALALARTGRRAEAAGPLAALADAHPRDEELLLELMRCRTATTGAPAALAAYDRYRRRLRDELGTDPGPALQELHQELLRGEAPAVRRGVPHEPNPLLGRTADIAAVTRLLHSSRVTSIVGPGGLGKTRLAGAVARDAEQRIVHLVPLAGVRRDDEVAASVASALGVGEGPRHGAGGGDVITGILGTLGAGPALLVLDNCEQVVQGVADLVQALVSRTGDLRVLTTSRAPLGLSSEAVHALPELDLATSVELFEQRARAARPDVDLPADTVAGLCRHLDGLPLATELAAARVRVMSVAEISRRLGDRFALLRGGPRDAPQRHRTLHAVVDWSWNLLAEEGRSALRALSVLPAGFTAEAADRLVGGPDTLEVLEELVDHSLLKVTDTPYGTRFRMLETVREFAAAHRERAGEDAAVTGRFLTWARDFGAAHHDAAFGADAFASWHLVRAEQDNLLQALRLALARADQDTTAAVTAVLAGLWSTEAGAHYARLAALAEDTAVVLSHYRPAPEYVEPTRTATALLTANALVGIGPGAARPLVALRRLPPAPPDTLLRALATVLSALPEALAPGGRGVLDALCASDVPLVACLANGVASYVWEYDQRPDLALAAARRMLDTADDRNGPLLRIWPGARFAELCLQLERGAEAIAPMRDALTALEESGEWTDSIGLRWGVMLAHLQAGDLDAAEHWLEQALRHQPEGAAPDPLTPDLGARAEMALARGDVETGLGLWRRALDRMEHPSGTTPGGEELVATWLPELQAAAVIAHARHGRTDVVDRHLATFPARLATLLDRSSAVPPTEFPLCGALLLALGTADLAKGDPGGVRLIALAERFRCLRTFQPTMSTARARRSAEHADRAAYEDAVSTYAALDVAGMRAAALDLVRGRVTA
ncbi:LuxR family transcriptional regulator [Streptomyces lincolnensis]|uniref:LuxR family transcriptional regulator n=1 Tax=Streptomyces lincolnensis TaxID=1915 RepID=A0A1B1MJL4_STRLN|nr:BTAD domain-containing putative transcriptional regulator [Streptomyces lincolnensis]ANS68727.1 LuxR family transcriptional regulator [Streptomyces lincolnensis]AXG53067.1 LuxR family transcriptional regulator [Streptomyces lincolnensis]QMV10333.1 AfsR/SARP family transcriptional regulator [Streptomyces lincolnensis]